MARGKNRNRKFDGVLGTVAACWPHIPGRHDSLLKLKPLEDDEATVIAGHQNGKQSVKVRDAQGHEFRLTCPDNLEIGAIVTFPFNGRKRRTAFPDTPPSFLRIR